MLSSLLCGCNVGQTFFLEVVNGFKIRDILLDNGNWWRFFLLNASLIRSDIIINVIKILSCGTALMGYHLWMCPSCAAVKAVFHTCKSRFCSSCGKKATDNWIQTNLAILPKTKWQHITFTFPQELRALFWLNRDLMNNVMPISANIMTKRAKKYGVVPGIFLALHTFGRDLKRNLHIHLSITLSGLSLDETRWINKLYFNKKDVADIKAIWRYSIVTLLREQYKAGNLKLPKRMKNIKTYTAFNAWLDTLYQKQWVVHFSPSDNNHKKNVEYLGRYLKRPPISETRICDYDGKTVTYSYYDHHDKQTYKMTLSVFDFIKRIITHIPDRYFRVIRYYNWLSNRTRGEKLPFVYKALRQIVNHNQIRNTAWRELIRKTFGVDPLQCPCCKNATLTLANIVYTHTIKSLVNNHQQIAMPCC